MQQAVSIREKMFAGCLQKENILLSKKNPPPKKHEILYALNVINCVTKEVVAHCWKKWLASQFAVPVTLCTHAFKAFIVQHCACRCGVVDFYLTPIPVYSSLLYALYNFLCYLIIKLTNTQYCLMIEEQKQPFDAQCKGFMSAKWLKADWPERMENSTSQHMQTTTSLCIYAV